MHPTLRQSACVSFCDYLEQALFVDVRLPLQGICLWPSFPIAPASDDTEVDPRTHSLAIYLRAMYVHYIHARYTVYIYIYMLATYVHDIYTYICALCICMVYICVCTLYMCMCIRPLGEFHPLLPAERRVVLLSRVSIDMWTNSAVLCLVPCCFAWPLKCPQQQIVMICRPHF